MAEAVTLEATARPRAGKGATRQVRREGKVPAVIYGDNQAPITIALNYNELWKQFLKGHFTSTVIELNLDGKMHRVIPRELQVDPVKDHPLHVDFLRIGKDGIIRVAVPVRFTDEASSPGLKRGGVLNIVRHDIEVFAPYDKIPEAFEISLDGMQIGKSIHVSSIIMPEGVAPVIQNRDFTVATIAGRVKQDEDTSAAAAAEPEAAADKKAAGEKKEAPAEEKKK